MMDRVRPRRWVTARTRRLSATVSGGRPVTEGGKTVTLIEGVGGGRAYRVAVKHRKTGEVPTK